MSIFRMKEIPFLLDVGSALKHVRVVSVALTGPCRDVKGL